MNNTDKVATIIGFAVILGITTLLIMSMVAFPVFWVILLLLLLVLK
jgi:hypothetical protein